MLLSTSAPPLSEWFDQDRQLDGLENELRELQTVNDDLDDEVGLLLTDDGIIGAAREELGHIQPGDNRETMQPLPPLPRDLRRAGRTHRSGRSSRTGKAAAAAAPADGGGDSDSDGGWIGPPAPALTVAPTTVGATTVVPATAAAPTTVAPATAAPTTSAP